MGFYVTALRENEEFMGNVGFNDDMIGEPGGEYAAELDDVAQIVKDINADYADQSSQEELDGQDLADDPVEECAIALAESEYNWNLIWKAVGTRELHEAATGKSAIMTENAVTDFFKKVKDFFVKLFKKITAFFKNWLDNALVVFRTNDSFVKKYASKLEKGKKAFDDSGKSIKGYDFAKAKNSGRYGAKLYMDAVSNTSKKELEALKEIKAGVKTSDSTAKIEAMTKDSDKIRGYYCGQGFKDSGVSESDYRDTLKVAYFGSEDKEALSGEVLSTKYILDVLKNSKSNISETKKTFEAVKKHFNSAVSICNEIEKVIAGKKYKDNDENANNQAGLMTAASKLTTFMKRSRSDSSTAFSMYLKYLKAETAQARKVGNAYIMSLNKSDRQSKIDKLSDSTVFGNIQMI